MFTHTTESFGRFERHVLENKDANVRMVLVPAKGAGLLELKFGDHHLLDGYGEPEALDKNSGAKSMPLFPFPNRLAGGKYTWKGEEYQFPVTDKAGPNAIHGVGRQAAFKVSYQEAGDRTARITCTYEDQGAHPGYPWPFTCEMGYRIDASGAFELEMSFTNRSDSEIPVGLGWHPYFQVSNRVEDAVLQIPPCQLIEVDDHMIPTGKRLPFSHFSEPKPIGNFVLDSCFALENSGRRAEVLFQGNEGSIRYWQETGPGKFNFIQLFTPEDRHSMAIEPMTCNIDAFHNGDGLITLAPGETASARCGIETMNQ